MKPTAGMTAELDGVLPVDKPAGPTSHDVVARARRALHTRRIGHTGTLDPFATGLLLLCIGRATRLAEYLTGQPKTYEATVRLGTVTETDDATGAVSATSDGWRALMPAHIEEALASHTGRLLQRPPAYSAKKVDGERSYRLARRGDAPVLPPVEVEVFALDLVGSALPDVDIRVTVSAGTYIRAIARDVGEALGVGAHLVRLRRTAVGDHRVDGALSLEGLDDADTVAAALLTPLEALAHLPHIGLAPEQATSIRHGRRVPAPPGVDGRVVLAHAGSLVAIAEATEGVLRPRKVFGND
jgi:tRNA pseudouridine55 synthase